MGTSIKKYLVWCNIERSVMKAFLQMFQTDYKNVRVQTNNPSRVKVDELFDHEEWADMLRIHYELIDRYERDGREANYMDLEFWKIEHANAPKGIKNSFTQRRVDEFLSLYKSIKKKGYYKEDKKLIKAIWIEGFEIKEEPKWRSRITEKYYRLNGKRRIICCKYLGIEEIPISLIKVKVVKL